MQGPNRYDIYQKNSAVKSFSCTVYNLHILRKRKWISDKIHSERRRESSATEFSGRACRNIQRELVIRTDWLVYPEFADEQQVEDCALIFHFPTCNLELLVCQGIRQPSSSKTLPNNSKSQHITRLYCCYLKEQWAKIDENNVHYVLYWTHGSYLSDKLVTTGFLYSMSINKQTIAVIFLKFFYLIKA